MGTYRKIAKQTKVASEEDRTNKLCFWLGAILLVLGVLIAAIIGKAEGARRAIKGCVLAVVVVVILNVIVVMMRADTIKIDAERLRLKIMGTSIQSWSMDKERLPTTLRQIAADTYSHMDPVTEKRKITHYIDEKHLLDSWGTQVEMKVSDLRRIGNEKSCEITLRSAGPDKQFRTEDDLIYSQTISVIRFDE